MMAGMMPLILTGLLRGVRTQRSLVLENLALRHQLVVLRRTVPRPRLQTAPRSPWQNSYVERLIGTLRRECLDHVVVLNETHLRRLLREYLIYDHGARTHLSLAKDAPEPRRVERLDEGRIVETPMVGGLHHRYGRRAA
jgi:transposase InsO family protein